MNSIKPNIELSGIGGCLKCRLGDTKCFRANHYYRSKVLFCRKKNKPKTTQKKTNFRLCAFPKNGFRKKNRKKNLALGLQLPLGYLVEEGFIY